MLLINRKTLANATWRNAAGESCCRGEGRLQFGFSLLGAKEGEKTAESADFS